MTPKRRIIPVFIPNYGCEHDCVFCDQRRISGAVSPVTGEDVDSVIRDFKNRRLMIEDDADKAQPFELAFYGGSFTALPASRQNELLDAAQPFIGLDSRNSIRISTRPDCIDKQDIGRLRNYGVATIEIGAQSMCDDVLIASGRGHTSADVERCALEIGNSGLSLILQMMTGLPCDTAEKSVYTAKRLAQLRPDGVRIYPTVVVRGTRLHGMWERGEYREHTLEDAIGLCASLYVIFQETGIPVIRLGLNPNETLSSGDAVAGAYHPALGELVYSRLFYIKADAMLRGIKPGSHVRIAVARGRSSQMIGQRRQNVCNLTRNHALKSLKIVESDMASDDFMIEICR